MIIDKDSVRDCRAVAQWCKTSGSWASVCDKVALVQFQAYRNAVRWTVPPTMDCLKSKPTLTALMVQVARRWASSTTKRHVNTIHLPCYYHACMSSVIPKIRIKIQHGLVPFQSFNPQEKKDFAQLGCVSPSLYLNRLLFKRQRQKKSQLPTIDADA